MSDESKWTSQKKSGKEVNFKFEKTGDALEGNFLGTISDVGSNGTSSIHTFKKADGEEAIIWGSFVLDDQLNGVQHGAMTRIVYGGKVNSKKGGNSYHTFEVFVDESVAPIVEEGVSENTSSPSEAVGSNATNTESDDLPF